MRREPRGRLPTGPTLHQVELVDFVQSQGAVTRAQLYAAGFSRREVVAAVTQGVLLQPFSKLLTTAGGPIAHAAARELGGVLSHTSAAQCYELPLVTPPDVIHVTIARVRRPGGRPGVHLWWADLQPWEIADGQQVTAPVRTVLDCARCLPMGEALVIADAAVARGLTTAGALRRRARRMRGPGSPAARRIAEAVDGRSESPLESLQRTLHVVWGFVDLEPQVVIRSGGMTYRADFADLKRKIIVETEGSVHRLSLTSDARRYTSLALDGWLVLRFTWAQVVYDPAYVLDVLTRAYASRP